MDGEFRSERYFKVWAYSVSKCRLLLRSTKDPGISTRIDVYFGGVGRMLLKPYYEGLHATEADAATTAEYRDRYGEIGTGYTLFTLEPDLRSFVVAGVMQWHEDDGGFDDPSFFGHFKGA
ncbi:hypothetical protein [Micromonospora deserti]|uniref:Uncharacterized protein n=1 Tax=Micromonospora deserti TaxID=2070366 RepID=A0A2W2CT39_9ACTN|nr:hypothetical protein [Micromonospora deserti]PZG02762.1 hypothetical protein C1I99_00990 [Micromonospora deserti]